MKLLLLLLSTCLANYIKAEQPSKSEVVLIPREQDSLDDPRKDDINMMSQSVNEQPKQAVMDTVQDNMISKDNFTDREVPEVIVSEPEREINDNQPMMSMHQLQQQNGLPLLRPSNPILQRIYKLPTVTRMISRESREEEPEKENNMLRDVKIPQWRSPLPFLHNNCIHSMNNNNNMNIRKLAPMIVPFPRRLQISHKRVHRHHHKHFLPIMALREQPEQPIAPIFLSQYPIIKRIEQPSIDALPKPAMIMTVLRRTLDPEPPMQPFNTFNTDNQVSPHSSLIISLLRRRPNMQETKPLPNPFMSLLSKLLSIPPKDSLASDKYTKSEEKRQKQNVNYNFNVNFTINNNYYKNQKKESGLLEPIRDSNRYNRDNSLNRYPDGFPFPNLVPTLERIMNGVKF